MKRFHELTKDQQEEAVNYALRELNVCVEMGIIEFPQSVTNDTIKGFAEAAAEDAWYSQPQDTVISDIASEE